MVMAWCPATNEACDRPCVGMVCQRLKEAGQTDPRPGLVADVRQVGGVDWVERCMRLLSVHYFAPQLDLIFEPGGGPVSVYAGTHEISRGDTLRQALELAVSALTDAELLGAMEGA